MRSWPFALFSACWFSFLQFLSASITNFVTRNKLRDEVVLSEVWGPMARWMDSSQSCCGPFNPKLAFSRWDLDEHCDVDFYARTLHLWLFIVRSKNSVRSEGPLGAWAGKSQRRKRICGAQMPIVSAPLFTVPWQMIGQTYCHCAADLLAPVPNSWATSQMPNVF